MHRMNFCLPSYPFATSMDLHPGCWKRSAPRCYGWESSIMFAGSTRQLVIVKAGYFRGDSRSLCFDCLSQWKTSEGSRVPFKDRKMKIHSGTSEVFHPLKMVTKIFKPRPFYLASVVLMSDGLERILVPGRIHFKSEGERKIARFLDDNSIRYQ